MLSIPVGGTDRGPLPPRPAPITSLQGQCPGSLRKLDRAVLGLVQAPSEAWACGRGGFSPSFLPCLPFLPPLLQDRPPPISLPLPSSCPLDLPLSQTYPYSFPHTEGTSPRMRWWTWWARACRRESGTSGRRCGPSCAACATSPVSITPARPGLPN